jgi:ADP-heptose:LPS heptosyltransferase
VARRIAFSHSRALGDVVVMTAAVRDFKLAYGDAAEVYVQSHFPQVWANNPHVAGHISLQRPTQMPTHALSYGPSLRELNNERRHFVTAFHVSIADRTKGEFAPPCTAPEPDLHLSDRDAAPDPGGRYWVLFAGRKNDFTAKYWSVRSWQRTADLLRDAGLRVVQVGGKHRECWNPSLSGALDLVGKTGIRDLFALIAGAEGVICPVTSGMHIAAAFKKPCVVVAGGREHWWWEAYVDGPDRTFGPHAAPVATPHRFLHTQGLLPCCADRGCWQNKVSRHEPDKHRRYCRMPEDDGYGRQVPKCLLLITPEAVVDAALSYYRKGLLAPLPWMTDPATAGVARPA